MPEVKILFGGGQSYRMLIDKVKDKTSKFSQNL